MTPEEMKQFKNLFGVYCRHKIELGHCDGDTCEWCPIQKAYDEVEATKKRESKVTVRIYDIKWDVDDEDLDDEDPVSLPESITHTFAGYGELDDELLDEIADWLSDEYGFCHDGFQAEEIKEEN